MVDASEYCRQIETYLCRKNEGHLIRIVGPVFEKASERHADIVFGKVDTEAEPQLSAAAKIMSIPTLMAFRDGILVFSQPGALPEKTLEQVIEAVRDLDMDDVRRQLDAQPSAVGKNA